jgi:hypothetical protein
MMALPVLSKHLHLAKAPSACLPKPTGWQVAITDLSCRM